MPLADSEGTENRWVLLPKGKTINDVIVYDFIGNRVTAEVLREPLRKEIEEKIAKGITKDRFHPDYYNEDYLIMVLKRLGLRFDHAYTGDIEHQFVCDGDDYVLIFECQHCFAVVGGLPKAWGGWYCPRCDFPCSFACHMDTEQFGYLKNYHGRVLGKDIHTIDEPKKTKGRTTKAKRTKRRIRCWASDRTRRRDGVYL